MKNEMHVASLRLPLRVWLAFAATLVAAFGAGCGSSAQQGTVCDTATHDAGPADGAAAPSPDAGTGPSDGGVTPDTGTPPDAGTPPPISDVTYNDITNVANWSTFDMTSIGLGDGFITSAFDGRYLYLVPGGGGVVPRYDTRGSFSAASSWSTFDVGTVDKSAGGFRGAAFDGRYIYLVPYFSSSPALGGVAVQYDTHADFGTAASWSTFDITTVNPAATGFFGAAFDGRYLYLVPYGQDSAPDGVVARYDTWGSFTAPASWVTFDTSTVAPQLKGYLGATFDGRYVYFSPYGYAVGAYASAVTRYDTYASFTDASSWSTFDTTTLNAQTLGFFGATFDGRYAYFEPYNGDGSHGGNVARYDTLGEFSASAAWSTYDTTPLGIGPAGAVFDGRFVYFVPSATAADSTTGGDGLLARLDTQASFSAASSWTTFDTTKLNANAKWFYGGAFDGEHVYFVPSEGTVAVQFDAKSPPSMPSSYHGSFY